MSAQNTATTLLLQRWQRGEQGALDELLASHLDWLKARVRRRLGPNLREKADANDYVQDVMVGFLEYGPKIQISDGDHLRALLGRIIENNLAGDFQWWSRKRRDIAREVPLPSDTVLNLDPSYQPVASPTQAAERSEQVAWFRFGLELLDPGDREVIVLRKYDELAFAAIAAHTKTSPDAARMRYQRAVSKLGREISKLRHNGVGSLDDHDPSYDG